MKHVSFASLAATAVLTTLAAPAWAGLGHDRHDEHRGRALVGAWIAQVTLINCDTRKPIGVPPFRALVVFHSGGTVSEASGPSVQRTPSYGTWSRQGHREYEARSVLLTYDPNGFWTGTQEIRRSIELSKDGDSFVADTNTLSADINGTPVFRGCARGEGKRFE